MPTNKDPDFRTRGLIIKEQHAKLAKHHTSMLWSDYFKPRHFDKYPQLHQLANDTLKALSTAKASGDPKTGEEALELIAEINRIFWETKQARPAPGLARTASTPASVHVGDLPRTTTTQLPETSGTRAQYSSAIQHS